MSQGTATADRICGACNPPSIGNGTTCVMPVAATSSVTATGIPARADGTSAISLLVTLRDVDGVPIGGYPVSVAMEFLGTATPASSTTDSLGRFATWLTSRIAGRSTVIATAGTLALQQAVSFTPVGNDLDFVASFGSSGGFGTAVDSDGNLYISNMKYAPDGTLLLEFAGSGGSTPTEARLSTRQST